MPIIVDPSTPNPIPPDTITSPDGLLQATYVPGTQTSYYCEALCRRYPCDSDAAQTRPGGVYLYANFSTPQFVPDPSFIDDDQNAARFPANWEIADGQVTIPESADGYRVWLVGDRVASTLSTPPAAPAPDNGAAGPVAADDVLEFAITATASIDREVRWQVNRYDAEGAVISGSTYVDSDHPLTAGVPDRFMSTWTVPDDGTVYVAVAFVAEGTFGGSIAISAPTVTVPAKEVDAVRFVRVDQDGNEYPVRGGDAATAVGGIAYAFDMEAPLEQTSQWYAVPIYADGTEGDPTERVALTLPWPDGELDCWIKPVGNPEASMMCLIIQPLPTFTRASRNQLSPIQGARLQAGGWDLHLAAEGTFTFWTPNCVERSKIIEAFTSGPVLFQTERDYQVADMYCLAGDITEQPMEYNFRDPGRTWSVPLTPIARPATADTPGVILGRSYADTHAAAGTYQIRYHNWPTYVDASRPVEIPASQTGGA